MVFQFYALYPALTVGENIAFPLHHEPLGARKSAARVRKVAEILHLANPRPAAGTDFGGREATCRCCPRHRSRSQLLSVRRTSLAARCRVASVDARPDQGGASGLSKATVIVTHDQLEALTMADRIAIMRDGLIEQVPRLTRFREARQRLCCELHRHAADEPDRRGIQELRQRKAKVVFDEQDVDLNVHPAVANLKAARSPWGFAREPSPCLRGHRDTIDAMAELIEPMGAETLFTRAPGRAATSGSSCRVTKG